jgi:glycosyltransferase involved in cell wall biosynthesis
MDNAVTASIPYFSVCIPAYENVRLLGRAMESVLSQTKVGLECVVSDDSDTGVVAEYVEGLNDPRVRYSRNAPAKGAPRNWNSALASAGGDIVTLLHHDDFYRYPETLHWVSSRMEAENADVLVCGRALYENGSLLGEYPDIAGHVRTFCAGFPARTLVVNRLGHPSVVFFRRHLSTVHYDEQLVYFSDTEYYYRLLAAAGRTCSLSRAPVGLDRAESGRLSARCLRRPDALIEELLYALRKHRAGAVGTGLAAARFLAANIRTFGVRGGMACLCMLRRRLGRRAFAAACATLPLFAGHMLYRMLYRKVTGIPWG